MLQVGKFLAPELYGWLETASRLHFPSTSTALQMAVLPPVTAVSLFSLRTNRRVIVFMLKVESHALPQSAYESYAELLNVFRDPFQRRLYSH
jgi:hypothetical protein